MVFALLCILASLLPSSFSLSLEDHLWEVVGRSEAFVGTSGIHIPNDFDLLDDDAALATSLTWSGVSGSYGLGISFGKVTRMPSFDRSVILCLGSTARLCPVREEDVLKRHNFVVEHSSPDDDAETVVGIPRYDSLVYLVRLSTEEPLLEVDEAYSVGKGALMSLLLFAVVCMY